MKKIILVLGILLLGTVLISANGDHQREIEEGKNLVESKVSCDKLSQEQLEEIGEYFMEQMHPGEQHEVMHQMMDMEEGTQYHQDFHVNIARMMYCREGGMMGSGGMMGMMPMMMNMMKGNMMGNNMMGPGMMGGSAWSSSWWLGNLIVFLFWIALLVALILLIIWLYKKITSKTTEKGSALEILKKRYAKGELTKKQYEEMKKELGG